MQVHLLAALFLLWSAAVSPLENPIPLRRRLPRLTTWLVVAALLIAVISIVSPSKFLSRSIS